ncbi:CPBP family intramembrane metalloprotease [Irregularibacter muris]|uniref:CPBP family intramembrane metalloprotease n=1 Tax=Irregularibacter muris TaxID=1796619 RepID=A0AAE3HDU1_9FIRM|nr:CPBP family intramembrane glutamic endopeptidase [Irregularibacter muris]MCR1898720.1 CPBP family intramembrane metalloprotease [Irregularibacter muris]
MVQGTELLKLLLIVIVIGLPPFLVALKTFREVNPIILGIMSIIYWAGTLYTQQVVPFILIMILIIKEYKNRKGDSGEFTRGQENKPYGIKDFFKIALFTLLLRFPLGIVNFVFMIILQNFGVNIQQQEVVDIFVSSNELLLNIFLFVLIVFMAPINEEFSMRHWLFHKVLTPKTGKIIAAILSSALFTLLHYNVVGIPTFFGLGLFACYIYHKRGFWGAITVHFIFNLSTVFLLMLTKFLIPLA